MSNKSGTSEQVISLPKGGGELKGLGESFSPDLHTGTGNFSVPISVPAGRNGFQPEIGLVYSTGNGNSCFGLGWQLNIPGVSRKTTKGIPRYFDGVGDKQQDTFLLSGAEDLVPVEIDENNQWTLYRPRTEGLFAKIKRVKKAGNDYWEVKSKDGLTSFYNLPNVLGEASSLVYNPENLNQIFDWKLAETRDPFGNSIKYDYLRDLQQTEERHWNQLYPEKIQYLDYLDEQGDERFLVSVTFEYEDVRPDAFSVYTAGFEVRTEKRCHRISIHTHPNNTSLLVRTYDFEYESSPFSKISILKRVQVTGHQDGETEQLPPLDFFYTPFETGNNQFKAVSGKDFPTQSLGNPAVELIDLFGNGLPDIIQMNGVTRYWKNLGDGKFDAPRLMSEVPAGIQLADSEVQFMDMNGNGRADLVVHNNLISGFFPTQFNGKFDKRSFQKRKLAPTFSLQDPEVKLMDLNGNGVTDALRSGGRMECFFNDPLEGWNDLIVKERKGLDEFPNVNLSDPRIRLADMTGDNMQDLVFIHNSRVEYWPNMGYGVWGKRIRMRNAPRLPLHYDPKRLLIGDIAGDGPHDIVYVGHRNIDVWINQNGNGFSEKITIEGTPPVSDMDSVRLVDLYGTGVNGILWSADQKTLGRANYFFLDFTNGIKPLVLREMNNNMGAITKVKYRPSTYFYLQDEKQKASRWKTPLPFPVQVVAGVEVIDEISKNKLVTEYNYHHGYWDGTEREYRGFGRVEQIDTQTFEVYKEKGLHGEDWDFQKVEPKYYTPPTKTISWFHQGPVEEVAGDWTVCDFSDEYWQGDKNQLAPFSDLADFLKQLPRRRERRDALRTLRGSVLRTELYALDGKSDAPYRVSESIFSIRKEGESLIPLKGMSGAIFMPLSNVQRSTQWERGDEPMTTFSFTKDYDAYGQARQQIAVACPRGWKALADNIPESTPFLSTFGTTRFIDQPSEHIYIKDRTSKTTSFEILHQGDQRLEDILAAIENPSRLEIIAQSFTYYDGDAFTGLPLGEIGNYGIAIRSENLIITESILETIWRHPDGSLADLPPYLLPNSSANWPNEYPGAFKAKMPSLAGYQFYDGTDEHHRAYWAESSSQFDFQDENGIIKKGLPIAQKDALGRVAKIEYDAYHFLPVKSIDPIGLSVEAKNDYRLFQAYWSKDPNENTGLVKFSPLGFVLETYALGKENMEEGDGLNPEDENAIPSSTNEYDWLAWMERQQPVQVKSTVREHHLFEADVPDEQKNDTITTIQFSDGFGRIIQSRAQAEAVLFGDELFGNEMLSEAQDDESVRDAFTGEISTGEAANVVVSGWQIYDNKGQVVQKYEPFYSQGYDYADVSDHLMGQKVEQFYDPLGRVVKTCNPDGSQQRVVFGIPEILDTPEIYVPTPWEAYTYDENDNADRTNLGTSVNHSHWNTPSSVEVDALGRAIKSIARNGQDQEDQIITLSTYDIRGNLLTVTDALGRLAFQHFYDLTFDEEEGSQVWRTENIDAGTQKTLYNVLGLPVESRDAKDGVILNEYDTLNRPTHLWARDNATLPITQRQKLTYGDTLSMPETDKKSLNLLGQLYQHYDEAGLVQVDGYDFKGNPLNSSRQLIKTSVLTDIISQPTFQQFQVDWERMQREEVLDIKKYETHTHYDALNRPIKIVYPEDVKGERKTVTPSYNRAGALESINLYDPGPGGLKKIGVQHIAYNAKGQRSLIAYHNGLMTRYAYDDQRFWLKRLRTEKYNWDNNHPFTFTPDGGVLQDMGYEYDLVGNITQIKERGPKTGIQNSNLGMDALNRDFDYDPIYRLLSATGREHIQRTSNGNEPWKQEINPTHTGSITHPNTRFYTRKYAYDKLGNMLELKHTNPDTAANFTRTFTVRNQNNQLSNYQQGNHTHQLAYDSNGNLTKEATSRHYFWNHSDALHGFRVQADEAATPTLEARYLYDAGGERVKKIVWYQGGKVTTTTYVGGALEHHTEGTSNHLIEKENNTLHLMDDQSRIVLFRIGDAFDDQDNSPTIQYQLGDHLGNVQVVAKSSGGAYSREEHYPYGGTSFGSYKQKRYRFTGKERDEESGLHYHSARYYAPWLFKWISADPAGMVDGVNLYGYVRGNPTNRLDTNGMDSGENQPTVAKSVSNFAERLTSITSLTSGKNVKVFSELIEGMATTPRKTWHYSHVSKKEFSTGPTRKNSKGFVDIHKKSLDQHKKINARSNFANGVLMAATAGLDYSNRINSGQGVIQSTLGTSASSAAGLAMGKRVAKRPVGKAELLAYGIDAAAKAAGLPEEVTGATTVLASNTPTSIAASTAGIAVDTTYALITGDTKQLSQINDRAAESPVAPIAVVGQFALLVRGKSNQMVDEKAMRGGRGPFNHLGSRLGARLDIAFLIPHNKYLSDSEKDLRLDMRNKWRSKQW